MTLHKVWPTERCFWSVCHANKYVQPQQGQDRTEENRERSKMSRSRSLLTYTRQIVHQTMVMQRACHISPALSCLRTADLVSTALPAALPSLSRCFTPGCRCWWQQPEQSWSLLTYQPQQHTQSCCHFAISAQIPPEGPCLSLGVVWGHTLLYFLVNPLPADHQFSFYSSYMCEDLVKCI